MVKTNVEKQIGICERHNGKGIVCFLDILGFSKYIETNWKSNYNRIIDAFLNLKKKINDINFSNGFIYVKQSENHKTEHKIYCNVKTVSDSLILLIPINDDMTNNEKLWLTTAMSHIIIEFWSFALELGFSIRGGVEFGDIYWDTNEVIGPAFIEAYNIESKCAKTSRVVCGNNFTEFLYKVLAEDNEQFRDFILNYFIIEGEELCINPRQLYIEMESIDRVKNVINSIKEKSVGFENKYEPLINTLNRSKYMDFNTFIKYSVEKINTI